MTVLWTFKNFSATGLTKTHRRYRKDGGNKNSQAREASTQYPPKVNVLRKRSISTEGSLSLSEKKVAIVSTEELHFYGTYTPFYLKDQVIVSTEEALDSPKNDRTFLLRNNLSFQYRTVRCTQNTTIFFKEGWPNFKEIVTFLLGSDVPSGPP